MRVWVLQRLPAYARTTLAAGVFLAPVVFSVRTLDVFNLLKLTVLWVCGVTAFAAWTVWSAERGVWVPRVRVAYAAAAFVAATALATLLSSNPAVSVLGLYHRYVGLVPVVLYAALMLVVVGLFWERPDGLGRILRAYVAATTVVSGYAVIQKAGWDWISWNDPSGRGFSISTLGNSDFAGAAIGIAIPMFLTVLWTGRRRRLLAAAVALHIVALWFTQSRSGMIAAGAGLAFAVAVLGRAVPRVIRAVVAAGVVIAAVLAVLVVWHPGSAQPPGPLRDIDVLRTESVRFRWYSWVSGWRMFTDSPVVGHGPGTYYGLYPAYRLPADGAARGLAISDEPHNVFIGVAAGSGALGLFALAATFGLGLWTAARGGRRTDGADRLLLASFGGALAAYLAQAVFSIDVPPLAAMGWIALGAVAAIGDPACIRARAASGAGRRTGRPGRRRSARDRRTAGAERVVRTGPLRRGVVASAALVAFLLVVAGLAPLIADATARDAQALGSRAPAAAERGFRRAFALNPLEPDYHALAGAVSEGRVASAEGDDAKRRLLEDALREYRRAHDLHPGNVFYTMNIARTYALWAEQLDPDRYRDADRWWRRAVGHDATDWEVRLRYAEMLAAWAERTGDAGPRGRARDEARRVLEIDPGAEGARKVLERTG